jgi:hypothetical protein
MTSTRLATVAGVILVVGLVLGCGGSGQQGTPRVADDALQAERLKAIHELQGKGILGDIENVNERRGDADLYVKPAFFLLDIKEKKLFVSIVYGWAFRLPRNPTDADLDGRFCRVHLYNSLTGKQIGTFDADWGLSLD